MKVKGIKSTLAFLNRRVAEIKKDGKASIVKDVIVALKEATPVDTGEARDGWEMLDGNIVNNVPHIVSLNNGSSKQAPRFFIEQVVLNEPRVRPNGTIVS